MIVCTAGSILGREISSQRHLFIVQSVDGDPDWVGNDYIDTELHVPK